MAAKKPNEPAVEAPADAVVKTPIEASADGSESEPEIAPEPEPIEVPRGAIVRALMHLDDSAGSGKYYRPGDVIEGWDDETIARMVASGIAEIV